MTLYSQTAPTLLLHPQPRALELIPLSHCVYSLELKPLSHRVHILELMS